MLADAADACLLCTRLLDDEETDRLCVCVFCLCVAFRSSSNLKRWPYPWPRHGAHQVDLQIGSGANLGQGLRRAGLVELGGPDRVVRGSGRQLRLDC